ncbi:AraC family transcriptional regulator [Niveispirillum sp.]|uniref:AraC family transcriptional regulator n=1 Tax=Niveispirillum sp. TaxID=1917217 RepID=UPI001B527250|nr:AraC family transcriptional regulator [Niveispirillum sp.]MBP7338023.1 AraC family transcriptional regulator [Niveispirillum sp.]
MVEKGSVSIHFVAAALNGLRARGMEPAPVLRKAGIAPALLGQPMARVPVQSYAALLREVAQLLDDEFFGQDSRRMKLGSFALACLLALGGGGDLGGALNLLCRTYNTIFDDLCVSVRRDGRRAALEIAPTRPGHALPVFAVETLFVYIHGVACWLVRRRIAIDEACLPYDEPAHGAEYFVLFGTQLRFGQDHCRLWFDAALLSLPVAQDRRSARSFLNQAPESFLVKYRNPDGYGRRIANLLRRRPPTEWPGAEAAAAAMRCSPATLRRLLRQEGTSFQAIKDRLRLDLAKVALSRPDLSIADISAQLGFAEPAAFNRAFRQWTGTTPARYRRTAGYTHSR